MDSQEDPEIFNKPPGKKDLALVNILGGLTYGYCTAIASGATPGIEADWNSITPLMSGLITASIILGASVGSLTGGVIADRIGRQKSAILMSSGVVLFSLIQATAPNMAVLLIARTILGFFVGLISVVCPMYVSEASPVESRGFLGSFFQVSITLGIVFAYVAGYVIRPEWVYPIISWRTMFGLGAVFAVFMLYLALFAMEESPLWLEQQKIAEDRRPLLSSSSSDRAHPHHHQHQHQYPSPTSPSISSHPGDDDDDDGLRGSPQSQYSSSASLLAEHPTRFSGPFVIDSGVQGWSGLFSKPTLLALSIGIVLAFDLQGTGINGIVFYLPKLLESAGLGKLAPILTIVVGIFNFLSTFFALFLVDRAGRKPLLLIGTAIMGVSLLLVGIAFFAMQGAVRGWFAFVAILIFHLGFEVGPGSLFWIIIAEIFPTGVRSEANGFINLVSNLLNLLVSLLFPIIFNVAKGGIFFFFSAMTIVAFAYIFFAYKETKDESPLQLTTLQHETLQ
jgi:SP family arabinose:H+ symporter-like MFS transporter